MKEGIRWRIGNGNSVQVWGDKWIPRPYTFLPITPASGLTPKLRVAELIDKDSRSWNLDMVNSLFWKDDAATITSIPLGRFPVPDSLGLDHDKFNMFVVVCWMMWKRRNALVMENKSSTPLEALELWRGIMKDGYLISALLPYLALQTLSMARQLQLERLLNLQTKWTGVVVSSKIKSKKWEWGFRRAQGASEHAPPLRRSPTTAQLDQERRQPRAGRAGDVGSRPTPVLQITHEVLQQLVKYTSTQAASRAVAMYTAKHATLLRTLRYPHSGVRVNVVPENNKLRPIDQQEGNHLNEEIESRPSLPEDELPPPPPRDTPPRKRRP
ncbi:UNVERIFIED_CONTAM: hypothetical protein Sradi_1326800 [Sesamum radiatum]|uniref:Uncharacterized protein n=1 Tax=Sesamum radiatum TaxID=300843 RepID=A0AAW2URH4_SESRA